MINKVINKEINNIDYNLTYDFIYCCIGIKAKEAYPLKEGFHIVDINDNNYVLIKVLKEELSKYSKISNILSTISENISVSLIGYKEQEYFYDKKENSYYIIFDLGKGKYKKWTDINLNILSNGLEKFYQSSENLFKNIYNCSFSYENIDILSLGNEIKYIDNSINLIKNIHMHVGELKELKSVDRIFLDSKNYIEENLHEAREFFLGNTFKNYCEDYNNIRFINGNLGNKSFIYRDDCQFSIVNFKYSSIDLFIKDIFFLISRAIKYVDNKNLEEFSTNLILKFTKDLEINIEILSNYFKIYNNISKWFYEIYLGNKLEFKNVLSKKLNLIKDLKEKEENLLRNLSNKLNV